MNEANNNATAVCSAQTVNALLSEARQGSAQSAIRNGPSEEANTGPVDGASDKKVGA